MLFRIRKVSSIPLTSAWSTDILHATSSVLAPSNSCVPTMVAYDSRRTPDPEHLLSSETVGALRVALDAQLAAGAGADPIAALFDAVRVAAKEGRERKLAPEALIIQLKQLANDVGLPPVENDPRNRKNIREWMITASLRAYWDQDDG